MIARMKLTKFLQNRVIFLFDPALSSIYSVTGQFFSSFFFDVVSLSPFRRMALQKIFARQIFDSRGNPTVEVDLTTEKGGLADHL